MSGDHNMNQTSSGWRKRQIALDKKAENARELGLNYEPNKTVVEMAFRDGLERFEALVRADEREECWRTAENYDTGYEAAEAIRKRANT